MEYNHYSRTNTNVTEKDILIPHLSDAEIIKNNLAVYVVYHNGDVRQYFPDTSNITSTLMKDKQNFHFNGVRSVEDVAHIVLADIL